MYPLRVYLDSSDLSVLSDPLRTTDMNRLILRQLRHWVSDCQIICLFSGTHLSEMAPLDARFAESAQRRADLLIELCGRNCFISQDRLFSAELGFALKVTRHPPIVISSKGEWYPDPEGVNDVFSVGPVVVRTDHIKDVINKSGMSRKIRREALKKALKHGKPSIQMRAEAVKTARTTNLEEVLQTYPMRSEDARILSRYVVGDASPEEAREAFHESLRDPRWMMKWFRTHHLKLSPFIEWTRGPAEMILKSINEMAEHAASIRMLDASLGSSLAGSLLSSARWKELKTTCFSGSLPGWQKNSLVSSPAH